MKLADKGPIKPPPALKGAAQLVSQEIQSWPGIVAATHWFLYDRTQVDGADFYVGERELGHIHLDGEIHLGATRTLAAMLIEHDLADPFEWGDAWVQYPLSRRGPHGCSRQPQSAEGAHPADARTGADPRYRRDPSHVHGLLTGSGSRLQGPATDWASESGPASPML